MEKNLLLPFPPGEPSWQARGVPYVVAALFGVSRLWIGGYTFGVADHSWQVPLVRGMASGELLQDYIFATPLRLSLFFPLMALLSRMWQLENVYFAAYVAASVAASLAVYMLAERMLSSRSAAILAVVLLLVGKDVAAGATTWDAIFIPRVAAMPLMLFSWWLLLGERNAAAGGLMGAAFAMHPLTGLYGAAIAAVSLPMGQGRWPAALGRFAGGMAAPTAVTLAYTWGSGAPLLNAPEEWYAAMLARNIHHVTISNFFLLAGLLVFGLAASFRVHDEGGRSRLLAAATLLAALLFMYVSMVEIGGRLIGLEEPQKALLNPPLAAVLQPLRITGPLGVLVLVATGAILWRAMQGGLVGRLAAAGALAALSFGHYLVGAVFIAAAVLAHRRTIATNTLAVGLGCAALLTALSEHKALFVLVLGVFVAAVLVNLATQTRLRSAMAALAASAALVGIFPTGWAERGARALHDTRGARLGRLASAASAEAAESEASEWIRANAGADEVTIVPPWWESWRVWSRRPAYGTYKDGTLVFFNAALAEEWMARMEALGLPLDYARGSRLAREDRIYYAWLTTDQVLAAAGEYRADYVVRLADDLPGLELAYRGRHVHIYRLASKRK